jgi:membrane protease YdiL (CAAX protease family)
VKFSQIYNVNLIFFIPLFLIVQFFFLALRIVASNGFGDLFLLLKNIYVIDIYDITSLDNISGMLLSPIWEEFLFRGVIFFILFRRFGLKFALFAPAILFAIFHIDPNFKQNFIGTTIISTALLIFFESVTKSLIVYKTKSLTIPTIMHIFGNFLSTIIFAIYDKLL